MKSIFTRGQYILVLIFAPFIFSGFRPLPKQNGEIVLQNERLPVTPKEFYIANIIDEREDRSAVAWLVPAGSITANQPKLSAVDLQGGAVTAIKQFIDHNLPSNKTLRPVSISLKKFTVTETALPGGRVEGHVVLNMSFDLERTNGDPLHLVTYNGGATYTRKAGLAQDIEPTLRHLLENSLGYINTWMDKQVGSNIKLARAVKVTFTDFAEKPEGDSIYYAANRPLTWDDFQSKISNNRFDAEVLPSVGYDEHNEVVSGIIHVNLAIKAYIPKSACWVRDGSRNDYTLNHEQRHFDIAKIIAEHFKEKVRAENLPADNFDGPINMDYLEVYREMHTMQKQYDDETRHGTDQSAQQEWNSRIDKELKKYGVK